jgi:hypothetical protein
MAMKAVSGIMLTLLLASILTLAYNVQLVKTERASTPSTVTSAGSSTYLSHRGTVQLEGYYYVFYIALSGPNNGYLCYKSSTDGITWGNENVASHAAIAGLPNYSDFDVFTDMSNIYVAYPVGTYSTSNSTGTTGYVRTGMQTNGTITWNTQVPIRQAYGYWQWDFARTTNRIYLAFRVFSDDWWYHVQVYYSVESFDYETGDQGYQCGVSISSWDFQHSDGVILVDGEYFEPFFNYWTFNGTDWSAKSTFGSKPYYTHVEYNSMSMVTKNGQVHFAYIPTRNGGGVISYQYFTTGWSSPNIVDHSTCMDPSLSATSLSLYLAYRIGSALYYRAMDYSSNTWASSAILFAGGESSPSYITSEKYPTGNSVGVVWRSGSSAPFNVKFVCIPYFGVPTLYVHAPEDINLFFNQTFTVSVEVSGAKDLYAYEFKLLWNSTLLDLVGVDVKTPSEWGANYIIAQNATDQDVGGYWLAVSALDPAPPINGSFTLVSLAFNVPYKGSLGLDYGRTFNAVIELRDTVLVDSDGFDIVHQVSNLTIRISLLLLGDITGPNNGPPDGKVDIRDIAFAAIRYGSHIGDTKYDVRADITGPISLVPDGAIDIRDIALIAKHFGETL